MRSAALSITRQLILSTNVESKRNPHLFSGRQRSEDHLSILSTNLESKPNAMESSEIRNEAILRTNVSLPWRAV